MMPSKATSATTQHPAMLQATREALKKRGVCRCSTPHPQTPTRPPATLHAIDLERSCSVAKVCCCARPALSEVC
jgi:hypothetical protein